MLRYFQGASCVGASFHQNPDDALVAMDDRGDQRFGAVILFALLDIRAVVERPFQYVGQVSVDARLQSGWNPIDAFKLVGMGGHDLLRQCEILGFERVPQRRSCWRGQVVLDRRNEFQWSNSSGRQAKAAVTAAPGVEGAGRRAAAPFGV